MNSAADLLEIDVVLAFDAWHFKQYGYAAVGSDHSLGLAAFKGAYEEIGGFKEAVAKLTEHIADVEDKLAHVDDEVIVGYFVGNDAPFYRHGNRVVPKELSNHKATLLGCVRKLLKELK